MSETNDTKDKQNEGKKTLTLKTLSLRKPIERDQVRQSFSHGRTKTVEVEVKRKRVMPGEAPPPKEETATNITGPKEEPHKKLSKDEFGARLKAVQEAIKTSHKHDEHPEDEHYVPESTDAPHASVTETAPESPAANSSENPELEVAREKNILPEPEAIKKETKAPVRQLPKKRTITADEITPIVLRANSYGPSKNLKPAPKTDTPNQGTNAPPTPDVTFVSPTSPKPAHKPSVRKTNIDEEEDNPRSAAKLDVKKSPFGQKSMDGGRKLHRNVLTRVLEGDNEGRTRSEASLRRARQKQKGHQAQNSEAIKITREVIVPEMITVAELSNRMAVRSADVVKALMKMGMMVTVNQTIDGDTAELLCEEFGHKCKRVSDADIEQGLKGDEDNLDQLLPRAPIVTVMGHVDHGKTSLLDALRKTDVVSGEAGGITQHIGAYQVTLKSGQKITFIDTPGHAAFSEMRARGANITDVVVLVVAADDGIMEQTVEALNHAKAAGVPIVVAINKMDKPDANPDRVRSELMQHGLVVEEFGGDILSVEVSAKKGTNLEKLEEAILLQAEILDLKANPHRAADGVIVEAKMDKGRGPVATALIARGTLNVGDIVVAGSEWGRIRALVNDHGQRIETALPAMPVEILGFDGVPSAGNDLVVVESEAKAREITEYRRKKERDAKSVASAKTSMENMMDLIAAGEVKEFPLVVKTDVQGSLEAIMSSLAKLGNEEVKVKVLHGGVGGINESDITLARASGGVVFGFNVRANAPARDLAKRDAVEIRYYSIIYDVLDDVKQMLSGLLAPTLREKYIGTVEIREIFTVGKTGRIAGCYVTEGFVKRGSKFRLLRDSVVIHEGELRNLRRFKDEVKEVKEGYECGMSFESYNDIRQGDVIECFEMESISREL